MTFDYWRFDRKNEIVQADPNAIIRRAPPASTTARRLITRIAGAQPNTFIYYDVDGNIATVTGFYRTRRRRRPMASTSPLRHRRASATMAGCRRS